MSKKISLSIFALTLASIITTHTTNAAAHTKADASDAKVSAMSAEERIELVKTSGQASSLNEVLSYAEKQIDPTCRKLVARFRKIAAQVKNAAQFYELDEDYKYIEGVRSYLEKSTRRAELLKEKTEDAEKAIFAEAQKHKEEFLASIRTDKDRQ